MACVRDIESLHLTRHYFRCTVGTQESVAGMAADATEIIAEGHGMMLFLPAALLLIGGGLYLTAIAWGALLPPFTTEGDRLFLIIPGQAACLLGVLFGFFAFGFSLHDIYGWMSDILTHGGGM